MSIASFLEPCSKWGPFVSLRESKYAMPAIQSAHLFGLTVFLVAVFLLNLRLTGAEVGVWPVAKLARTLRAWAAGALALGILSGTIMFVSTPQKYVDSGPFRIKMALLLLALLFHLGLLRAWKVLQLEVRPHAVRWAVACISLALWFGVGWAGRFIAFVP